MTSLGEEIWSKIFENILGEKVPKHRPLWLRNHETGFKLELYGYSKSLKLAFEYDGIQHFEFPNQFHQSKYEFDRQRKRDEMKKRKCEINKVALIRIKYNIENLEGFIRQKLKEKKFCVNFDKVSNKFSKFCSKFCSKFWTKIRPCGHCIRI